MAGEPQEFFQYLPTTSQSPQPREWFAGTEDESILSLLDPLDAGKPDLAPPEIWRDYIRTVGGHQRRVGRQADVESDAAVLDRAAGCRIDPATACWPRSATSSARTAPYPHPPARCDLAGGVVLAGGADPGMGGRPDPVRDARATYHAGAIAHVVTMLRAQEEGWQSGSQRKTSNRSKFPIRCCGAT